MPVRLLERFAQTCRHEEHVLPPDLAQLEPGRYENTCPACGHKSTFVVDENGVLDSRVRTLVKAAEIAARQRSGPGPTYVMPTPAPPLFVSNDPPPGGPTLVCRSDAAETSP